MIETKRTGTETFIVICTIGADEDSTTPYKHYALATRQIFATREEASAYAATVHPARAPFVVVGRWEELRGPSLASVLAARGIK